MVLDGLKENLTALVLITVLIGAGAIALDSFQDNIEADNPCANSSNLWNASMGKCLTVNTTGVWTSGAGTYATIGQYNITESGLTGTTNAADFFPTIGTLLGVAALIAVVVGAFYFVAR